MKSIEPQHIFLVLKCQRADLAGFHHLHIPRQVRLALCHEHHFCRTVCQNSRKGCACLSASSVRAPEQIV